MKKFITLIIIIVVALALTSCINSNKSNKKNAPATIYIYGEEHNNERIDQLELDLWYDFYHDQGMRHLFIESPYYVAQFLNLWMLEDDDDIIDQLYLDLHGSNADPYISKQFYSSIKKNCPQTIFHGTDVGHAYNTSGLRYLRYLEDNGLQDSEQYLLTNKAIDQGQLYYRTANRGKDHEYRENTMVQNFIYEFDKLDNQSIMGIYGAAHTEIGDKIWNDELYNMATQLHEHYKNIIINSVDLTQLPLSSDTIIIEDNEYVSSYFGLVDTSSWNNDTKSIEFWRLENAYEDFKNHDTTDAYSTYISYPFKVETNQIFMVAIVMKDGSKLIQYYRSEDEIIDDNLIAREIVVD